MLRTFDSLEAVQATISDVTRAEELRGSVTKENFKKQRFEIRKRRASY